MNWAPGHNGQDQFTPSILQSSRAHANVWEEAPSQETGDWTQGLPAEAELPLMIKGPLVTHAEKSSSDPRWKREGVCGAGHTGRPPRDPVPTSPLQRGLEKRPLLTHHCLMVLIPRNCSFPKGGVGDLPPTGALPVCHFHSMFRRTLPVFSWTGPHANSPTELSPAPLCPRELSCSPAHVHTRGPSSTTKGPLAGPGNKAPLSCCSHSLSHRNLPYFPGV